MAPQIFCSATGTLDLELERGKARGNLAAAARRLGLTRRKVATRLERLRTVRTPDR